VRVQKYLGESDSANHYLANALSYMGREDDAQALSSSATRMVLRVSPIPIDSVGKVWIPIGSGLFAAGLYAVLARL
jgi:hypothetical protein